ncbi:28S ribosomal protein S27, mitochondrial [Papilio machaon]|uniref:28S ribosomal protein S27, mitochondrial n=1 Tax=Papilio machaon TaxID=76193 RepID=A0A194RHT2_PAPMA|nr:28S ribosomal protein S27, mitochondrial [Papilio machaon]
MLIRGNKCLLNRYIFVKKIQKRSFLTKEYKCEPAWNAQKASPILNNVNLNDFYTTLSQNYAAKGVISAIDVDIFANAIKEPTYLDELKELLHKLRLSAETGNTLQSTHHATVRSYIDFGNDQELIDILKDPLNYGVFLDDFAANILLDKLITSNKYELAAEVAALIMLQEDFTNEITCTLSQYACYKYIINYKDSPPEPPKAEEKKKIEEKKIRIKFLRNYYHDDHFDIKDLMLLSGKTLAWISRHNKNNVSNNLQIIGWMYYKKYDSLLTLCENFKNLKPFKIYSEVIDLLQKESSKCEEKDSLEKCISFLNECPKADGTLEESIKNLIEDAINKTQKNDISSQQKLFEIWLSTREEKLNDQIQRLARAQRIVEVEKKQKELEVQEQKLWFFENEEKIDLEIESKEKLHTSTEKSDIDISDENYIPPEILPKRK